MGIGLAMPKQNKKPQQTLILPRKVFFLTGKSADIRRRQKELESLV